MLLPIIRDDGGDQTSKNLAPSWPDYGPSIEKLVEYTRVFFDRAVHLLPAAHLRVSHTNESSSLSRTKGKRKKQKTNHLSINIPGAFASKSKFKLFFPKNDGSLCAPVEIAGRADLTTDRIQLKVDSLLDELSSYRYSRHGTCTGHGNEKDFCIMGITMEDLFDGPSDLFCAGMAFGGDKVAVFSFKRYHPLIKMHPLHWHKYGYSKTCDGYSYFDDDDQNPKGLSPHPPLLGSKDNESNNECEFESEFLRRSSKLLSHELGHLYGLDHCIHNRCLMMGTGHLVEDFRAPSHLCGICL